MDLTPERLAELLGPDSHDLTIVDVEPIVASDGITNTPILVVQLVHADLADTFHVAFRFVSVPLMRQLGETAIAVATFIEQGGPTS